MSAPTVSVLIPCFNAGRFVGETLESVFRQSWKQLEVIAVDDGSTDDTLAILRQFERHGLVIRQTANSGAAAARNRAWERSTGAFIQFLDADDLLSPDKIATQLQRLAGHPGCVASARWGRFRLDPARTEFVPEAVWRDMAPLDWLAASGVMFPALWLVPRAVCAAAGPWNEELSLGDDGEYFTRILLNAAGVCFCPDAIAFYRSGIPGSLSGRKTPAAFASQFKVNDLCERAVLAREESDRVRRIFALTWQWLAHASYPYDAALAERALQRAAALHPISIEPDGGRAFKLAARLLGWRRARQLQVLTGRQ